MSDIDALVETVREPLIEWGTHLNKYGTREKCLAALSELAALARERDEYKATWHAATAAWTQAEGERDRLKAALREIADSKLTRLVIATHARAALADVGGTEETSA